MRENPVISDWVPSSGGSTEGLLGGWLAQRQAALRGMVAAGALSTFTLGRPCVPICLEHLVCHRQNIFGKATALAVKKTRPGPEPRSSSFESFANFDDQEMSFNSNHTYAGLGQNGSIATRSCTPQLTVHDYGAFGPEVRTNFSELPKHSTA
jgi:hypothetical protein